MVDAELRQPWTFTAAELEGFAQGLHDEIDARIALGIGGAAKLQNVPRQLFWPPTLLVEALDYVVVEEERVPNQGAANALPKFLIVEKSESRRKVNLRIAHEWAEDYFAQRGGDYSHADVWALTLMLLIPRRMLAHAELNRHVPRWVAKKRRALAREAARAA